MSHPDEHRGHRLTRVQSPRGNVYWLPEAYAGLLISECIRRLAAEGWERREIHRVTKIRYQHVRNVAEQAASREALAKSVSDAEEKAGPGARPLDGAAGASVSTERSAGFPHAIRHQIAVCIKTIADLYRTIVTLRGAHEDVRPS